MISSCATVLLTVGGCATPKPDIREVDASTAFEQLPDKLLAKFPGVFKEVPENSLVAMRVRTPRDVATLPDRARSDFSRWCRLQKGQHLAWNVWNKPVDVKEQERLADALARSVDDRGNTSMETCVLRGEFYVIVTQFIDVGFTGQPIDLRTDGKIVVWLPPEELKVKGPVAAERWKEKLAKEQAAFRAKTAQESRVAQVAEQGRSERRAAFLKGSKTGTQVVCSGRQLDGGNLANVWFKCAGQDVGITTFQNFVDNGWRVSSQTLVPVLMTSGNVQHDATVIFEKAR